MAFIVFQMLLIPLVSFVKNFCEVEESKIYDGICVANVVILVVTTVLQFLGIRDYRKPYGWHTLSTVSDSSGCSGSLENGLYRVRKRAKKNDHTGAVSG